MAVRFTQPWPVPRRGAWDVLRWKLGLAGRHAHEHPHASAAASWQRLELTQAASMPVGGGWRVTWLGHASFLLGGGGSHLLIDPVFSDRCGPVSWLGVRRRVPPPCDLADLPPVAGVALTHGHYDHCDLPTLRLLGTDTPLFVPPGHAIWLRRHGFRNITELAWWESTALTPAIRITAVPARHFNARSPWDYNRAHWCGWVLETGGATLWHSGDSAWMPGFREIGARLGPFDCGLVGIGAYAPRWFMEPFHMNPAEAVRSAIDTRCRRAFGMHWGTFPLGDEPLSEPPLLLAEALRSQQLAADYLTTGAIGCQWDVPPQDEWTARS